MDYVDYTVHVVNRKSFSTQALTGIVSLLELPTVVHVVHIFMVVYTERCKQVITY